MNRRGFITGMAGILAGGVAPAFIGSSILMPVRKLIVPDTEWREVTWAWTENEAGAVEAIQNILRPTLIATFELLVKRVDGEYKVESYRKEIRGGEYMVLPPHERLLGITSSIEQETSRANTILAKVV